MSTIIMTIRVKTRYKICRKYKTDVWARAFIEKKITKFANSLVVVRRRSVSLGNFTGVMEKIKRVFKKRRTKYAKLLITKQKFLHFYGRIKNYQLKRYLVKNKRLRRNVLVSTIREIEQRIDVLLARSHLVQNAFEARIHILHKNIVVNNKTISKPSYVLNLGDIVAPKLPRRIWKRLKRTPFVLGYSSQHLFVNWKTMKVALHNKPQIKKAFYPFALNQKRLLELYKI